MDALKQKEGLELKELPIDPCELSKKYLIAVMFSKSSSCNYDHTVALAGAATYFRQADIEGKEMNLAGFDKTYEDLSRFIILQEFLYGWKGSKFFASGHIINSWESSSTIRCYMQSLMTQNYEAHCYKVIGHPFNGDGKAPTPLLMLPCKRLYEYEMGLSPYHPATLIEQIQALGVRRELDWCLRFKPEDIKEIER